jgi:hypothetical protein
VSCRDGFSLAQAFDALRLLPSAEMNFHQSSWKEKAEAGADIVLVKDGTGQYVSKARAYIECGSCCHDKTPSLTRYTPHAVLGP